MTNCQRFAYALAVGALVAGGAACSGSGDGGDDATAVPAAAPASVPASAELVSENIDIGQDAAVPDAPEGTLHTFYSMSCADNVLTVVTTKETVYAQLPCERALPAAVAARFAGVPVRVRVTTTAPAKLYIESQTAGSTEFTVGSVWIEER